MEIVINKVIMSDLSKAYNRYSLEGVFPTRRGTATLQRPNETGTVYPHGDTYTGDNINDPWYDPRTGIQWTQVPETPYWEPVTNWYNQEDQTVDESWETLFALSGLDHDSYSGAKGYIEDTIDSEYKPYVKIHPTGSSGFSGDLDRAFYRRARDSEGNLLPENPDTLGVFYGSGEILDDTVAELAHWLDFTRAGTESSHSDRANLVGDHLSFDRANFPDRSSFEKGPGRYGEIWFDTGSGRQAGSRYTDRDTLKLNPLPFSHMYYPFITDDGELAEKTYKLGDTRESENPVPGEMWTHRVIEENYNRILNDYINRSNRALEALNLIGLGDWWYDYPKKINPLETHGGEIPIFDPLSPESYSEFMEPHDHDH